VQLLSFLEHPFAGAKIPFFRSSAIANIIPGRKHNLIKTRYGNAGMLICNEIIAQKPYRATLKLRPHFLTIISNDAWFEGSMIPDHHFFSIRLRAVESGKNTIVNCNRGISGIINFNGVIQIAEKGSEPTVVSGIIKPSRSQSFYASTGDWFIVLMILFISIILIFNRISNQTK
jgi:apolipoprotein N-acyltransferase